MSMSLKTKVNLFISCSDCLPRLGFITVIQLYEGGQNQCMVTFASFPVGKLSVALFGEIASIVTGVVANAKHQIQNFNN